MKGCDGSILLDGSPNEKDQPANIGIRPEALQTIEDLRSLVHKQCGKVVSCADLVVLAARDAVSLVTNFMHIPYINTFLFLFISKVKPLLYLKVRTKKKTPKPSYKYRSGIKVHEYTYKIRKREQNIILKEKKNKLYILYNNFIIFEAWDDLKSCICAESCIKMYFFSFKKYSTKVK